MTQKLTKRQDWKRTHASILNAYFRLFAEGKRPPTQEKIAKECDISRETVNRHIRDLKLEDFVPNVKVRTYQVLNGLSKRAEKGYAAEVRLWMQLIYGWNDKLELKEDGLPKFSGIKVEIVNAHRELREPETTGQPHARTTRSGDGTE